MASYAAQPQTAKRFDLAVNLLRRALDPACELGEALNSADKFVRISRREEIGFSELSTSLAIAPKQSNSIEPPPAIRTVLRFGKHKGMSLKDILEIDAGYAYWLRDECDNLQPHLRAALEASISWFEGVTS